jgi:arabinose-5-phosphate isomerase
MSTNPPSGPPAALDPLEIAREVLRRESEALAGLADSLGESFTRTVELLEASAGRVIVTGVGKSGLVGGKIAATLVSTGTSAFFLHPTEAIHGDLGVVTSGDVVLALSKSGRSVELLQLMPHFQRLGPPVVAVVGDAASPLAREANLVLDVGPLEEACSLDLVPTTSTTAFMALGDALAVTLFRRRGLRPEDFAFVHPGGVIGRQVSRRVRDLMHEGEALPRVRVGATVREALVEIVEKGLGVTTVVEEDGSLAGILTDGDLKRMLLRNQAATLLEEPVGRFMTRAPRTIEPEKLVATAVRRMEKRAPGAVTCLVVIDGDAVVGVIHLHDCLQVETPPGPRA